MGLTKALYAAAWDRAERITDAADDAIRLHRVNLSTLLRTLAAMKAQGCRFGMGELEAAIEDTRKLLARVEG
ncbi:hypothetical protein [Salinarimonas soli]|uniref:Uncharacterized protein n=1 Tax=Salinarimonas soli TaxID=1638099 RepID=A0A5B2VQ32_9HYPH|nr:hypothetical protein [Salinarimonas soli]KAA2241145.1 hypothetical protein F0L46_04930 [Salinarimonas soli]